MPGAVSNTSPLVGLSTLGRLELLREYYSEVWIPPAVWREVVEDGGSKPGSGEVSAAVAEDWIQVVEPDRRRVERFAGDLDEGEVEAIALALTSSIEVLVMDEVKGRRRAAELGINLTGTVGILTRSVQEGRSNNLRRDLDTLIQAGFYIREDLYRQALAAVGETPSQSYP